MNKTKSYFPAAFELLQIFAEGGSSEGTGTGNSVTGSMVADAAPQVSVEPSSQATNKPEGNNDDLNARFDELIKGEFKEVYGKRINDTFRKRMKNSKETTEKFEKLQSVLPRLAQNYSVDPNDIDALVAAVQNDNSFYEKEALEAGVDVEFYKRMKQAEEQNQVFEQEKQMRENITKWHDDFETNVKTAFPNLTFDDVMDNPQFVNLMHNGIDALSAVTAIHARDLIPAAMEAAAKEATKRVVDDIAANSDRPVEGAAMSSTAVVPNNNVSSYSDAQIEAVLERVRRGETGIDFKNKF